MAHECAHINGMDWPSQRIINLDSATERIIPLDGATAIMSIELTQKVIRLESNIKQLLERLEQLENRYNSENNPEEKPTRGRRRKNENEWFWDQ